MEQVNGTPTSPEHQPDGALTPLEYNTLIGPPLKVCAALAASRGDQWLATDMPSMLALMHLIRGLRALYSEEWGALGAASEPVILDQALPAALTMVMKEAEFAPESVPECLDALERAYQQLRDSEVIPTDQPMLTAAWRGLSGGDAITAETLLGAVAGNVVSAIDDWERNQTLQ